MELDPFQPDPFQQGWRPQFRLITMLGAMVLFSVLAAVLAGLLREGADLSVTNPAFIVFLVAVLAAPLGVMTLAGLIPPLKRFWRFLESRRRRPEEDDDD